MSEKQDDRDVRGPTFRRSGNGLLNPPQEARTFINDVASDANRIAGHLRNRSSSQIAIK
jgi:hypothetical protein